MLVSLPLWVVLPLTYWLESIMAKTTVDTKAPSSSKKGKKVAKNDNITSWSDIENMTVKDFSENLHRIDFLADDMPEVKVKAYHNKKDVAQKYPKEQTIFPDGSIMFQSETEHAGHVLLKNGVKGMCILIAQTQSLTN